MSDTIFYDMVDHNGIPPMLMVVDRYNSGKSVPEKSMVFCHYCSTGDLMKDYICVGRIPRVRAPEKIWKPGHTHAIPQELEPVMTDLYRLGYGYPASSWLPVKIAARPTKMTFITSLKGGK